MVGSSSALIPLTAQCSPYFQVPGWQLETTEGLGSAALGHVLLPTKFY